jgi:ribose 5-phosphate isomerase B
MADKTKPIVVGADHLGLPLKDALKAYLIEKGYQVDDVGVNTDDPVLYPDIAVALSEKVAEGKYDRGVLVCGTGIGMAMTANKVPGVRAAVIHDSYSAERARGSNDAQVACFGSLVIGVNTAKKNLDIWLEKEFDGGGSAPKVDLIKALDEKKKN